MKRKTPRVFFNASVIIAGLVKPSGGSGKLLGLARRGEVGGIISEVVLDEVLRHTQETGLRRKPAETHILRVFPRILAAPNQKLIESLKNSVLDYGDAHLLASAREARADFLVSLDKKHVLSLREKKKFDFKILSPGELIQEMTMIWEVEKAKKEPRIALSAYIKKRWGRKGLE